MNSREFQSAVFIKLDSCMAELRGLKKYAKTIDASVRSILPQSHLQPFSKPPQKSVGRDLNIASWFREKTRCENAMLPPGSARKYLEFPAHVSEDQLNDDLKRCMHSIMCERLKPGWETLNWTSICNLDKVVGEQLIREAAQRPEMAVIAQSAGYWAIRTIAEQRQKSTKRTAAKRSTRERRRAHQTSGEVGGLCRSQKKTLGREENRATQESGDEVNLTCTEEQLNVSTEPKSVKNAIDNQETYRATGEAVAEVPDLDGAEDLNREKERELADSSALLEEIDQSSDEERERADREPNINANWISHRQSKGQGQTCSDVTSMIKGMSEESIKILFAKLLQTHTSKADQGGEIAENEVIHVHHDTQRENLQQASGTGSDPNAAIPTTTSTKTSMRQMKRRGNNAKAKMPGNGKRARR